MLLEDQRFIHEDLERLEQGISDRVLDDPRHVRIYRSRLGPTKVISLTQFRFVTDLTATTKSQASSIESSNSPNAC